ncbi:SMC family ATPase [Phormidium sp. FACHB-592]|uniref:Nuclease SbcCD subunit C n=1 Tax=Stenomitos frigidus AS-A4 TaxID=2933935 RepID=A0ABV0KMY8_9CYAN|nr:SMC family ATPase [Phormidium sp. FACHB-592]MBD2074895.1 SMC family ATPase [Phormidium sp. FACHB-592]
MEILSVSLKNFKSHSDRHFTFQPGTNAICGENGAGKTSILEAIAWALFDYAGDYNKEDLVRNGAASAQVRVAFISSRDGRTYEVQRCTSKSYTLYDPQLDERLPYSRIKEEVIPWLREHLGVAPGTDLSQLFSSTIGVPQGTFAVDFLLTKEKRKPIFDKILKVEEYQQSWKKLGDLEKYAKGQVEGLEQEIAHYDDDLTALTPLLQKRQEQSEDVKRVQTELEQVQVALAQWQHEQSQLSTQATQLQQFDSQLEKLVARIQTETALVERLRLDLQEAEKAVAICTANREAFQAYGLAEKALNELEQQQRSERQLQQKRQQNQEQLRDRQTKLATLNHQLDRLQQARAEIIQLEPLIGQQQQLEQSLQSLNQQLQECVNWQRSLKDQEKRLAQVQTRVTQIDQNISRIQALKAQVQQIPHLEQQQQRYQQQLSRIAAAAQFEADLRQLLEQSAAKGDRYLTQVAQAKATLKDLQQTVPLWSEPLELALTTLQSSVHWQEHLMTALQDILKDLAEQTSETRLEQQLQKLQADLKIARQQQVEFSSLDRLLNDREQLIEEAIALQASLTELHTQLAGEPLLKKQHIRLGQELDVLGDPRGRCRLQQQELQQEPDLQVKIQALQNSLTIDQRAITTLDQQLAAFADLAETLQKQQALREQHRAAHQEYLEHQKLANSRRERDQLLQTAIVQLQTLEQDAKAMSAERDRLNETFDAARFQTVQTAYQETKEQSIALNASLPDKLKYLTDLDQQLIRLETIQTKRSQAQGLVEQKRKTQRFVKFARDAYKKAGPRITERYVQNISREADRLFRELLNRPNVGLEWTREYEILVQEGAHTRRFINLSGGEQMCAALAVRLALLKVLADIDIAFFDEPTTNMDKPRRDHLAEAIANIKTFRQLFVISHDDTFEKVTENIILVEREA